MITAPSISVHELVDPKRMATVQDLDLIARWVVEGLVNGLHRSPYVGFSVDFASHREYMAGDDLRHLNWKLYGRHDKLYIKQYDAETNVDLHLVLDVSGSMTVGDDGLEKLRYATLLNASLAHLAARQRDAVGLTLFADRVVEHLPARGLLILDVRGVLVEGMPDTLDIGSGHSGGFDVRGADGNRQVSRIGGLQTQGDGAGTAAAADGHLDPG